MTEHEFMVKCDYEGGIEEAIFGYGLRETDLDVQEGEFYEAVKELVALSPRINQLTSTMQRVADYE